MTPLQLEEFTNDLKELFIKSRQLDQTLKNEDIPEEKKMEYLNEYTREIVNHAMGVYELEVIVQGEYQERKKQT